MPLRVSCLGPVGCLAYLVGGVARSRSPLAWLGVVCPRLGGPLRRAARAVGAGGVGVWTRDQPHSTRSCELALRAVGAARQAREGRLLPGRGASVVGRSPTTDRPYFGACGWGPPRTGCGCGGCGRGDLCALVSWLHALFGRLEGALGGCLLPGYGASGVRRSPTPDCPSFGACSRGPLPTGCGCGGCVRGDPSPNPQRELL